MHNVVPYKSDSSLYCYPYPSFFPMCSYFVVVLLPHLQNMVTFAFIFFCMCSKKWKPLFCFGNYVEQKDLYIGGLKRIKRVKETKKIHADEAIRNRLWRDLRFLFLLQLSSFSKHFIVFHYPKPLYLFCFPSWNPPSYQIPPVKSILLLLGFSYLISKRNNVPVAPLMEELMQ